MNTSILEQTAQALAALDFTAENQQIDELEAKIREHQAAIGRADERRREISKLLYENTRPDGKAVAEALLANASPVDAALAGPSREQMEAERASLQEGIRELTYSVQDLRSEIDRICSHAAAKTRDAAQPLADHIFNQARQAVAGLPSLYAAMVAVSDTTRASSYQSQQLREAIGAMHAGDGLLQYERIHQVPEEIVEALKPLATKGKALRDARQLTSVGMP